MSLKNFAAYFLGGFAGGMIYELIVYLFNPYEPKWINLIGRIVVISVCVAIIISLFKYFSDSKSGS